MTFMDFIFIYLVNLYIHSSLINLFERGSERRGRELCTWVDFEVGGGAVGLIQKLGENQLLRQHQVWLKCLRVQVFKC